MCEKVVKLSVQELYNVVAEKCKNNLINSWKKRKMTIIEDELISCEQAMKPA